MWAALRNVKIADWEHVVCHFIEIAKDKGIEIPDKWMEEAKSSTEAAEMRARNEEKWRNQ